MEVFHRIDHAYPEQRGGLDLFRLVKVEDMPSLEKPDMPWRVVARRGSNGEPVELIWPAGEKGLQWEFILTESDNPWFYAATVGLAYPMPSNRLRVTRMEAM